MPLHSICGRRINVTFQSFSSRYYSTLDYPRFYGTPAFTKRLQSPYACDALAERLDKYRPGGFHPVHLGDVLGDGRYKIIHKLGYGGFSTVWAARDRMADRNVAIKINLAEISTNFHELRILQELASSDSHTSTCPQLVRFLDQFRLSGPNGQHLCIVTEILGPSVQVALHEYFLPVARLFPARWAAGLAKQLLQALALLHQRRIGHGDIHTHNIVLKDPSWDHLPEEELLSQLGKPYTQPVYHRGNEPLEECVPRYLVSPSYLPTQKDPQLVPDLRLIDFGQAFDIDEPPKTLSNPMAIQAPEIVFGDRIDHRVDLWNAGCAIFELIAGGGPFSATFAERETYIEEMVLGLGAPPARWASQVPSKQSGPSRVGEDVRHMSLEDFLLYCYEDAGQKKHNFTQDQIKAWACIVGKLMKYEPGERSSAASILHENCFQD